MKKYLAALAATSLLALSACGTDDDVPREQVTSETPGSGASETPDESAEGNGDAATHTKRTVAAQQAVATAARHVDGIAFQVDDDDDGWEVEVLKGDAKHEVKLDSTGKKVRKSERDDRASATERDQISAARVSLEDAILIGSERVGGDLDEAEFEIEGGTPVWQVKFKDGGTEWELHIDAANGEILKEERD